MIDRKKINEVKKIVIKQYPEFKGIEPKIITKTIKPQYALFKKLSLGIPKQQKQITKLKFTKEILTNDKTKLERIILVTLNDKGEIIKIAESR